MTRKLLIAALPMVLGGCLPLPITIVSTAASGISYLASGKSTTDHVLSATMEEDCALTRPIFGEPVCREIGPNGEGRTPAITVASYPGDRDDERLSDEERLAARTRGALTTASVTDEARQVAAVPRFLAQPPRVTVAGIVVTKDQVVPAPGTRALPVAAETSWSTLVPPKGVDMTPLPPPVPASTPAPVALPASQAAPSTAPAALKPAEARPVSPKPATVASVSATKPAHVETRSVSVIAAPAGADRWVVLGSFREVERARTMAARFAARDPQILAANVNGGQWHRVALGPLTPAAARKLKGDLGKIDGRQPWVAKLSAP